MDRTSRTLSVACVIANVALCAAMAALVFFAPGRAPDGPAAPHAPRVRPDDYPCPPLHPSGSELVRQQDGQHYFHFRDGVLVGAWRWRTREYFPRSPYGVGGWGGPSKPPSDFTPPSGDVGELPPKG